MNPIETNCNTMKQFETMINTVDVNLAEELIASDATFYSQVSPEPLKGGKGYLSVVFWLRTGFSDAHFELDEMICDERKCAVRWKWTGTHDGEFLGVKATHKKVETTFMNFYYFNDAGKVINDIAGEGLISIFRSLGLSK